MYNVYWQKKIDLKIFHGHKVFNKIKIDLFVTVSSEVLQTYKGAATLKNRKKS